MSLSEEKFRYAMQNAPIGMCLFNSKGEVEDVNAAFLKMILIDEIDLIKHSLYPWINKSDLMNFQEELRELISGRIFKVDSEYRLRRTNSEHVVVRAIVTLARESDGTPKFFIMQTYDLTEFKIAEKMKNEFLSIVSHELKTPITSIRGANWLIKQKLGNKILEDADKLFETANQNCEKLAAIVSDMIDANQLAMSRLEVNLETANLQELLNQACNDNIAFAEKKFAQLKLEPLEESLFINVYVK